LTPLIGEDVDEELGLCGVCSNQLQMEVERDDALGLCMHCFERKALGEIKEGDGCFTPLCQRCLDMENKWNEMEKKFGRKPTPQEWMDSIPTDES
jgi:hypothetical protein